MVLLWKNYQTGEDFFTPPRRKVHKEKPKTLCSLACGTAWRGPGIFLMNVISLSIYRGFVPFSKVSNF